MLMSKTDAAREEAARDTCRIFAAAYEPPSLVGVMLYEAMALGAVAAVIALIGTLAVVLT